MIIRQIIFKIDKFETYQKNEVYVCIQKKVEGYEEHENEHANVVRDRVEAPVVQVNTTTRSGTLQRIIRPANYGHSRPE